MHRSSFSCFSKNRSYGEDENRTELNPEEKLTPMKTAWSRSVGPPAPVHSKQTGSGSARLLVATQNAEALTKMAAEFCEKKLKKLEECFLC